MNLTQPQGPLDTPTHVAGDPAFLGVDERQAPNQLPAGLASYGQNLRFRRGRAATRAGVMLCPWMKEDGRTPWTEVYGGVVFSDPNQNSDWLIVAADGGVWKTRPNMVAQPVPLPTGVTLTAQTFGRFVPCTDGGVGVLVLLRGADTDPLVCLDLDAGFQAVPAHVTATRDMPRASYGINHLNRLLLIEGKDIVAASDALAYNEFVAIQNEYRINPGNSQRLLALLPMSNQTLLCFKSQSVLLVGNVQNEADGSLSGIGPDPVTDSYGLAGANAVVRKGANAYWVTNEPGVTSLRLTEQNETQDTDVRLSDALEKTFGRINPNYLHLICLEVWDGKLYVALPLDDAGYSFPIVESGGDWSGPTLDLSHLTAYAQHYVTLGNATSLTYTQPDGSAATITADGWFAPATGLASLTGPFLATWTGSVKRLYPARCNAVAVYDFVTQAWCGVDESTDIFAIKQFLKAPYLGRQRLFLLGTDGTLRLYEEGFEDEVFNADGNIVVQAITSTLITRGYATTDSDRSRALAAVCRLRTWDPSYTLQTLTQAYNSNETQLDPQTRDRTRYDQHNTTAWNPSNDNRDHANPGREDYSVTLNDPDGLQVDADGVDVDAHQVSTDRVALDRTGDWQQLQLTNTQGRLELLQVLLEQVDAERNSGVQII